MHKELRQRISKSMNSERCLQFTEETFLISYFVEVGTQENGHFKVGNIDYPNFGEKLLANTFVKTKRFNESVIKNNYTHYRIRKMAYLSNMGSTGWIYLNETTQGEI